MNTINDIIHINPLDIEKFSVVWESRDRFYERIKKFKCRYEYPKMYGDWDLVSSEITEHSQFKGYEEFKKGKLEFYKPKLRWDNLYNSIKKNGYIQNPNSSVCVSIGRDGTLFLVDGLHRVIIARDLGIKTIPVKIIYIHNEYNFGKLNLIQDDIIPEMIYEFVKDKWSKDKEIYQTHDWMDGRLSAIKDYLWMMNGCDVLDVGCNAFISSWSIMSYANSLVGIEQGSQWCDKGKTTIECLKSKWPGKKVEIVNEFFKDYILKTDKKFNVFFGMCIMYWLTNEDIEILKEKVLPKCQTIIVSSRLAINKYSNSYEFNYEENLVKFFSACGFTVHSFCSSGIIFVIGVKPISGINPKEEFNATCKYSHSRME